MAVFHKVGLITMVAVLAAPAAAVGAPQVRYGDAGRGREQTAPRPAYNEGYRQGQRYGEDHGRRGSAFNFGVILEYRQGDVGYRAAFGSRDSYRTDFRVGFERGYRESYERFVPAGRVREVRRPNLAFDNGSRDGYAEGLNDGRSRHRDDPFAESRYRNADHGFDFRFGSREFYRVNYRDGFRSGYERGYADGWRRW